jgi:predicted DNA-binding transcriptional regulator AlpA
MGRHVDLDDLLDATEVATLLGLSSRGAVSVYRQRYEEFPQPAVERASGRCQFWVREDIEAWQSTRRERGR